MQEITAYKDLNGKLHSDRAKCEKADGHIRRGRHLQREVAKILQPLESKRGKAKSLDNGDWIQHSPAVVLRVAKALMALVKRECPESCERLDKLDPCHGFRGIANELTFFFGRLYSAGVAHRPLETAANMLGRIRADGREFNQPYFTMCPESEIQGTCVSDNSKTEC